MPASTPTAFLRALIAEHNGALPVERFMQEALYHPQFGYYARRVAAVGKAGDFSTSATLHPALGTAIGAWARAHRAEVAPGGKWHLIELGGGGGQLAASLLPALGWWARRGLTYHVVEISEGLRAAQTERLRGWRRTVRWHADIGAALAAADGRALIFSNEFVDAFPCVQVQWDAALGEWREVCVDWPEGAAAPRACFAEKERLECLCALRSSTDRGRVWSGKRAEIHDSYRQWLEEWTPRLRAGRLLTIDYGGEAEELNGGLRAYFCHQRIKGDEVFARFGQQDLTADVCFSDLRGRNWRCGFGQDAYGTQADFLRRWLPPRLLARAAKDPALAYLLDEHGAGGAFKVLEQVKTAVPVPA